MISRTPFTPVHTRRKNEHPNLFAHRYQHDLRPSHDSNTGKHSADELLNFCQHFIDSLESRWLTSGFASANQYHHILSRVVNQLKAILYRQPQGVIAGESNSLKVKNCHFLNSAMNVLEKHLDDPAFDMAEFADALCVSKSKLYRTITELTGSGPNELIRNYRLSRAAVMLQEGSCSVKEVAYQCGFSHLSYFAKCFRKKYGKLPSEMLRPAA